MEKEELIKSLKNQGFSEQILSAFKKVKREKFIPEKLERFAYEDEALPIGKAQTISQPYTIAFMLSLLNPKKSQKILEVGSGSGYVLALISEICPNCKIFGIERIKELAERAKKVLKDRKNIQVICGDGSKGLPKKAPFDRILVSASAKDIPKRLLNQLKLKGILVASVRDYIMVLEKTSKGNKIKKYPGFCFVPLIEEE